VVCPALSTPDWNGLIRNRPSGTEKPAGWPSRLLTLETGRLLDTEGIECFLGKQVLDIGMFLRQTLLETIAQKGFNGMTIGVGGLESSERKEKVPLTLPISALAQPSFCISRTMTSSTTSCAAGLRVEFSRRGRWSRIPVNSRVA
jgi:hypothetical protein